MRSAIVAAVVVLAPSAAHAERRIVGTIVDDATGLRTITVGADLVLVVRDDADHTLAYAKTSLLTERLGLTGGVYDGPH